jgi:hypothetical protein
MAKVKIVKNERDLPLFTSKLLIKFQNIQRNTTQVEIGWTDVESGGYILVSCAHSNTSFCLILSGKKNDLHNYVNNNLHIDK